MIIFLENLNVVRKEKGVSRTLAAAARFSIERLEDSFCYFNDYNTNTISK